MSAIVVRLLVVVACVAGTGCTTLTPLHPSLAGPPPGNLQLVEAAGDPDAHRGAPVRWGGEIVDVAARGDGSTDVVVLERPLEDDGAPRFTGPSNGRFLIRAAASVDPALYRRGTHITVAGRFTGTADDRASRAMPLVAVTRMENWGYGRPPHALYHDPFYDPFYDPFHDPFYRPWHHHHHPHWRFGFGIHH